MKLMGLAAAPSHAVAPLRMSVGPVATSEGGADAGPFDDAASDLRILLDGSSPQFL